jgi:Cytochrome bd terminal oxidase subunit II
MLEDLAVTVLIIGLTAYAVLGGADFGAGFWDLTAGGAERGARIRGMVKRSMGPVWEANHVWLIFVLVIMWTCFPHAFGPVMETLYVPLFLAAVGIIFRGAAFALRGEAATISEARALGATFAMSSVLVPFFLGAAVGAVASGQVTVDGSAGGEFESWTNATSLYAGALLSGRGSGLDPGRDGFGDPPRLPSRPTLVRRRGRRRRDPDRHADQRGGRPVHHPAGARGAVPPRAPGAAPGRAEADRLDRRGGAAMTLARVAAVCFLVGCAVLFVSESLVPQLAGVIVMFAGIAAGVFAIASPEFLAGEAED